MTTPEFTCERYIPGQGGAQIAYEHLHRYLFAERWAKGKRVLDVATGAGYGASLLSRCARLVIAMDIDQGSLRYARKASNSQNLKLFQGDVTRIPLYSGSIDLVIALEVLEHLADQENLVREIARVCAEDGVVLISTPNKVVYSDARGYRNPFHVHEFSRDEFLSLLGRHFSRVKLLSQRVRSGSVISGSATDAPLHEIITDPPPAGCVPILDAMYFLAICSHRELREPVPADSVYLDVTDALMQEWERRLQDSTVEIGRLNDEIQKLGNWGKDLEDTIKQRENEVQARDRTIVSLQEHQVALSEEIKRVGAILEERDGYIRHRHEEYEGLKADFDDRGRWAKDLESQLADRDELLNQTNIELERVADRLARIRHHLLYRILCRLGLLPK